MPEYYFKRVSRIRWEVAKFSDRKEPEHVLEVKFDPKTKSGFCPRCYSRDCTHTRMIGEWWLNGMPIPKTFGDAYFDEVKP